MRLNVMTDVADGGISVYLLVRLTAEALEVTQRRPINLALVIDRSSSMRGPRLQQAIRAASEVVEKLGESDRLTIVSFDGSARTVFGPDAVNDGNRAQILHALGQIESGVGTNLAAALKKGASKLRAGYVRDALARMIILTDGQPSVGITDADRLCEIADQEYKTGITITTMGIGESFEDELLAEIARRGRGGFYFLATPADIPAAFGRELDGVFAIAATSAELKFVPHDEICAVDLLHRLPSQPSEEGLTVEVGEIAAGAPRQLLFRLSRRASAVGRHCGTIRLTYRKADGKAGDAHILGVEIPEHPEPADLQEVMLERLRLAVATSVDLAWARRASGDSNLALVGLAEIKRQVLAAKSSGTAPGQPLDLLVEDLCAAEEAVVKSAAEREIIRRGLRERSQITMLGHSMVSRIPTQADED